MTEQIKKLTSHSRYQCTITIDKVFNQIFPNFDWKVGQDIGISYDEEKDIMTVKRIHWQNKSDIK